MRGLVNALSVNNVSGRYVLAGHLKRIANWTAGTHRFTVLYHASNIGLKKDLGALVDWRECPPATANWLNRSVWEIRNLGSVAQSVNADFIFTPSGTVVPSIDIPQIVFAQNPWALVAGLERSGLEKVKVRLQKRNYRQAVDRAQFMYFNSSYMREAYRSNAGNDNFGSQVVYQALDDSLHDLAEQERTNARREPLQILSVSEMAPHKNAETLVRALAILRSRYRLPVKLVIAGSWPNDRYRKRIESLMVSLDVQGAVEIAGFVSRDRLNRLYSTSHVFCLMSRCESFGIPAIEAQVFGTPVVSSDCCAIPEVCGKGGVYVDPDDAEGVAVSLAEILEDRLHWEALSDAAIDNASKYRWDICSQGLMTMFDHARQ